LHVGLVGHTGLSSTSGDMITQEACIADRKLPVINAGFLLSRYRTANRPTATHRLLSLP